MRKLVSTLMAVTLMLVSATACAERITPSKNYVTKKVNVGSFNAISTSSSVDVIYTQSSGGQNVEIYAPDKLKKNLTWSSSWQINGEEML